MRLWIWLALLSAAVLGGPGTGQEYLATTTASAVVRQAPGQQYGEAGIIPAGTPVDVSVCFDEGAYCAVKWAGDPGFVAGDLMMVVGSAETVLEAERTRWANINAATRPSVFASDIVAWGDSLTASAGASSAAGRYPAVAASLFSPPRIIDNRGVGGETSTQIKARFLAAPHLHDRVSWIWAGRNNAGDPQTVLRDIEDMVAALGHERYLVGAVLNGDYPGERRGEAQYARMVDLNAELRERYGERFVDLKAALIAAAASADAKDVADDIVPRSLRHDLIHLNDAGYRVVARAFEEATERLGF